MLITNAADIYFDFNPPIRTPDVRCSSPTSSTGLLTPTDAAVQVVPNPTHDRMSVVGAPDAVRVMRHGRRWPPGAGARPAQRSHVERERAAHGLYTVQVFDASGAVRSTRVVKQ
jgi:hypothetical protein